METVIFLDPCILSILNVLQTKDIPIRLARKCAA